MTKPRTTHDGAEITIYGTGKWREITIDRIFCKHTSDKQAAWATMLADCATSACFDRGRRKPIFTGTGTTWSFVCPAEHVDDVLGAISSIEMLTGNKAYQYMLDNRPRPNVIGGRFPGFFDQTDRVRKMLDDKRVIARSWQS